MMIIWHGTGINLSPQLVAGYNYDQLRTSRITMMLVHKVLYCVHVAIGTTQREWSVTSLVDCICIIMYKCTEWCSNWCAIQCLLLGSQWCSFTRYLTVSKWPLAQARESGVSPALLTVSVEDHINNVIAFDVAREKKGGVWYTTGPLLHCANIHTTACLNSSSLKPYANDCFGHFIC